MKKIKGTSLYIAPEVLQKNYDSKCDLWSTGVICYLLLCGNPPFYGDTNEKTFKSILKDPVKMDGAEWDEVSDSAKEFVGLLLQKDPACRPTA